jgi:hypothetical protein
MPSPPSTSIILTNTTAADIIVIETTVPANGTQSFAGVDLTNICYDLAFRLGLITGGITLSINGVNLVGAELLNTPLVDSLIEDIGNGSISVP